MASPRVFISSTYYDLKQYREDLRAFVEGLGYEPVMHDKGNITYTQNESLEDSCYNELSSCEIVVCIIGNKYGTQSVNNNYSITMNEIKRAIKEQKKVYVYILKEIYTENEVYYKNKDNNNFKPAYADNIQIHEFISELKNTVKNTSIMPFENVSNITDNLKQQFAGLFQLYIRKEAATINNKTYEDLKDVSLKINDLIKTFASNQEMFFKKFDSSIYTTNYTLQILSKKLGLSKSTFFAKDREALREILYCMGFEIAVFADADVDIYTKETSKEKITLTLQSELFDENGFLMDIRSKDEIEKLIDYKVENTKVGPLDYNPFDED